MFRWLNTQKILNVSESILRRSGLTRIADQWFIKKTSPLATGAWLGHQEALYSGLRWHLNVPHHNTQSQFNPPNSLVFPGKTFVNPASAIPNGYTGVDLEGYVGSWTTDIELALNHRPRLYGFDFSRVTEVWDDDRLAQQGKPNIRRAVPELQVSRRDDPYEFSSGEFTMMKDLILSTLYEGGEACVSYHMFNPFVDQVMQTVGRDDLGNYFQLETNVAGGLGAQDFTDAVNSKRSHDYIKSRFHHFGSMLNEILGNPHINASKNIYIRLFHEPNIDFFWWGQPNGVRSATFLNHYYQLWYYARQWIFDRLTASSTQTVNQKKARIKFVFSINGEATATDVENTLNAYLPDNLPPPPPSGIDYLREFTDMIDVIGLDFYQDNGISTHQLGDLSSQYSKVVSKATAKGKEHALTEVGIRTEYIGKLYGAYTPLDPFNPPANPSMQSTTHNPWNNLPRNFFQTAVAGLANTHNPKWVMFWANRLGNSAIDSMTPTNSGSPKENHSNLYYGDVLPVTPANNPALKCIDVFNHPAAEIYTPLSPKLSFSLTSPEYGSSSLATLNHSHQIHGGIDSIQYIPGGVRRTAGSCTLQMPLTTTQAGGDYEDAIDDFRQMTVNHSFKTL